MITDPDGKALVKPRRLLQLANPPEGNILGHHRMRKFVAEVLGVIEVGFGEFGGDVDDGAGVEG